MLDSLVSFSFGFLFKIRPPKSWTTSFTTPFTLWVTLGEAAHFSYYPLYCSKAPWFWILLALLLHSLQQKWHITNHHMHQWMSFKWLHECLYILKGSKKSPIKLGVSWSFLSSSELGSSRWTSWAPSTNETTYWTIICHECLILGFTIWLQYIYIYIYMYNI